MAIADAYTEKFTHRKHNPYSGKYDYRVSNNELYDFLYENEYQAWFCNLVKHILGKRSLKEWFLKIHTGESLYNGTKDWSWENRAKLGQKYLVYLAKDYIKWYKESEHDGGAVQTRSLFNTLIRRLEIDGYDYRNGEIKEMEIEVLDVEAEIGLLESLYRSLGLANEDKSFEFLSLTEDHYVAGRWSDSISNARKFFESVLQEVARKYSMIKGSPLAETDLHRPVVIRQFLEKEGLLEKKERETVEKVYGLLSHTGGHPYMAEKDQARLLRQLCLTLTQFLMLRLEGSLKKK